MKLSSPHEVCCKPCHKHTAVPSPGNTHRQNSLFPGLKMKRSKKRSLQSVHRALRLLLPFNKKKPQIKPLWPQRFSVSQLSFSSHQDRIFCTRNQIPVSEASCTAGVYLLMAFLCCCSEYLVQDTEAQRIIRQWIIRSGLTKRITLKQNVAEVCGEAHQENNYKGLNAVMEDHLRLTPLKFQSRFLL